MKSSPTLIPGLRSPYEQVGGMYHFGRMLDKIRIHQAGKLPPDWVSALGAPMGFDGRCCRFLEIEYADLKAETLKGGSDEQLLEWAFQRGHRPNEEQIYVWNGFISKLAWRDKSTERLHIRLQEIGKPIGLVETMFDFIEIDEGRPARFPS
ncbi:MAG TPA: DUF5069 domain-containing protein [Opitutaceae bacterium]|nr:DUF5069 domain-containing protein [Opitutaceae bacterium]